MLTTVLIVLIVLVILILLKVNAFLAFLVCSILAGLLFGLSVEEMTSAVQTGLGNTLGSLTIILGFGAVLGKIMAHSGAARQIANQLVKLFGTRYLKWGMAMIGFLVGLPMFFAIGFVILVPLMFSVASKAKVSFIYLGIPLVAALSVTHGLLPPHPAPAAIAQEFGVAIGEVILWGLVLSIPTIILAGPLFASTLKGIQSNPMAIFIDSEEEGRLPGIGVSLFCTMLPVALLMLEVIAGELFPDNSIMYEVILFLSHPLTAMLISTIAVMYLLEIRRGSSLSETMKLLEEAIKGIALILLIIGGAGALNEVFKEAGFNKYLAELLKAVNMSPILLCWSIAALIRVSVGSATVAAITTAGILGPIYAGGETNAVLLVLATGSGSIIFSHVNDGGFWLFKEYFNLSIKETLLSWSLMETIIALSGLAGCLILNMFI